MMNKQKRERGSVTIEATISLSAFMFTIVTLLTILNICMVQAKIGVAINATAKEISQYTYLYSVTGIDKSIGAVSSSAKEAQKDTDKVISDVNEVFTEIQNLGKEVEKTNPADMSGLLNQMEVSKENIEGAAGSLAASLEKMADDPKATAMGLAKILANDMDNFAKSLIARSVAKGLCKKNLVFEDGGDVEAYLKFLGVVPAANGSYYDGLDFSGSTIFPDGTETIRINVEYDVNVIALLPIDFSFHFNQVAITHGWSVGENNFSTKKEDKLTEYAENETLWTESVNPHERQDFIRHQVISDLGDEGYEQITGMNRGDSYQDIHVYNSEKNEFAVIHSRNPLYSAEGEPTVKLEDLNDAVLQKEIEYMCAGISSTAASLDKTKTKKKSNDGSVVYTEHECKNAKTKVVLVIPEDDGLKEKFEKAIAKANKQGVEVELHTSYGNGARTTEVKKESETEKGESDE